MTTTIAERPTAKPVILYSVTTETIDQMAAKFAGLKINGIDDTLETLHPAIDDITNPVVDASFEVTP